MSRISAATIALIGLLLLHPAQAGEFNKKVKIGDPAPAWTKLPGVDGKTHSLADLKDKDVLVIAFTCNHCPVAVGYEDRLIELTRKYSAKKVAVIAINVNNLEADRLPRMVDRSREKHFNFPYLYDESQQVGRDFGATFTPEFYVLNKERKIVYMGAMDDEQHKDNYVELAVQAALKGQVPAKTEARPRGCTIRYETAEK